MCGHNGIIHGGLLATILDEAIARPVSCIAVTTFVPTLTITPFAGLFHGP